MILSRSDRNKIYSSVIEEAFLREGIPFSSSLNDESPLFSNTGIQIISILRLLRNKKDHLALKTLLMKRKNNIGEKRLGIIQSFSIAKNIQFFDSLEKISQDDSLSDLDYKYIKNEFHEIKKMVEDLITDLGFEKKWQ